MANQSGSRGSSSSENRGDMNSQWRDEQSGNSDSTQMQSGKSNSSSQMNSGKSSSSTPSSGSSSDMDGPDSIKQSDHTGSEHTNAGNTGFGSGQISQQTHSPGSGKSSRGSTRSSSGNDKNR